MVTVRIFATDQASGGYVTRLLQSHPDFQIVAGDTFQVAVFASEGAWLVALRMAPAVGKAGTGAVVIVNRIQAEDCVQWLAHGVFGIVAANRGEEELAPAVRRVAAGRLWLPIEVFLRWITIERQRALAEKTALTAREREVLFFVRRGWANKDIAWFLRITERTVKSHVTNLLAKLGAHSRQQLTEMS